MAKWHSKPGALWDAAWHHCAEETRQRVGVRGGRRVFATLSLLHRFLMEELTRDHALKVPKSPHRVISEARLDQEEALDIWPWPGYRDHANAAPYLERLRARRFLQSFGIPPLPGSLNKDPVPYLNGRVQRKSASGCGDATRLAISRFNLTPPEYGCI